MQLSRFSTFSNGSLLVSLGCGCLLRCQHDAFGLFGTLTCFQCLAPSFRCHQTVRTFKSWRSSEPAAACAASLRDSISSRRAVPHNRCSSVQQTRSAANLVPQLHVALLNAADVLQPTLEHVDVVLRVQDVLLQPLVEPIVLVVAEKINKKRQMTKTLKKALRTTAWAAANTRARCASSAADRAISERVSNAKLSSFRFSEYLSATRRPSLTRGSPRTPFSTSFNKTDWS